MAQHLLLSNMTLLSLHNGRLKKCIVRNSLRKNLKQRLPGANLTGEETLSQEATSIKALVIDPKVASIVKNKDTSLEIAPNPDSQENTTKIVSIGVVTDPAMMVIEEKEKKEAGTETVKKEVGTETVKREVATEIDKREVATEIMTTKEESIQEAPAEAEALKRKEDIEADPNLQTVSIESSPDLVKKQIIKYKEIRRQEQNQSFNFCTTSYSGLNHQYHKFSPHISHIQRTYLFLFSSFLFNYEYF